MNRAEVAEAIYDLQKRVEELEAVVKRLREASCPVCGHSLCDREYYATKLCMACGWEEFDGSRMARPVLVD